MKKLILLCLSAVMFSGCASGENAIFRERIVPDFEQIITANDEVFKAYEDAAAAASAYAENPTDENREAFFTAAEMSDKKASENAVIQSQIGDEEYAVMNKLNLPKTDYDYLFAAQESSMAELADWAYIVEWTEENDDTETLTHLVASYLDQLELEKVYLTYGAMDWVVDTDKENAEYFKEMIYKYPNIMPQNCEWLIDHEQIAAEYNARLDIIEERINAETEYTNKLTRSLRQGNKEGTN